MIAEALEARGYGATDKISTYFELRMKRIDYIITVIAIIITILVILLKIYGMLPSWLFIKISNI